MFGKIFASLSSILIGQNPVEILPPPADIRRISGGGISNFPAQDQSTKHDVRMEDILRITDWVSAGLPSSGEWKTSGGYFIIRILGVSLS